MAHRSSHTMQAVSDRSPAAKPSWPALKALTAAVAEVRSQDVPPSAVIKMQRAKAKGEMAREISRLRKQFGAEFDGVRPAPLPAIEFRPASVEGMRPEEAKELLGQRCFSIEDSRYAFGRSLDAECDPALAMVPYTAEELWSATSPGGTPAILVAVVPTTVKQLLRTASVAGVEMSVIDEHDRNGSEKDDAGLPPSLLQQLRAKAGWFLLRRPADLALRPSIDPIGLLQAAVGLAAFDEWQLGGLTKVATAEGLLVPHRLGVTVHRGNPDLRNHSITLFFGPEWDAST